MTETMDAPRAPGRPRSIRADEAILEAALDLLAEGSGIESLSIEAIAARAGVGKATIYRRWPGKEALLQDALRRLKPPPSEPSGRSVREDLITLVGVPEHAPDPRLRKIMPCIMPMINRSPEQYRLYQDMVEPRRRMVRDVLRRGIELGELRADLDPELTVALLTAPLIMQRLLRAHPGLDEQDLPARVVDAVISGIAAR